MSANRLERNHDFQRVGPQHEARGHGVHQPLLRLNIRILQLNAVEHLVPEHHAVLLGIALGDARHLLALAGPRQLEGVADDALAPFR